MSWIVLGLSCGAGLCASDPLPDAALPDSLRLDQIQAVGTHNSYHVAPRLALHPSHRYTHAPLTEQLDVQGVRQLEIDVHLREGHSLEVFHLPVIDEGTHCLEFESCLRSIRDWSAANPAHVPLLIWVEPKDELDEGVAGLVSIEGHYDLLEEAIRAVWPREALLVPDDLRGEFPSLPRAIAERGWPTLGACRGKTLFALLDTQRHRDAYVGENPTLEGRLLFAASSHADQPFAALFKLGDVRGREDRVRGLLDAGFLVTATADHADATVAENRSRMRATLLAGVQYVSTDFPAAVDGRDYWLRMPGGAGVRANPVTGPAPPAADGTGSPGSAGQGPGETSLEQRATKPRAGWGLHSQAHP
ncbi:MAG: Ca2+-dependent phosphoinositide-specific phospholipase C [Planctomycetota bacterium]|nr:Ca2+-dependent phosphoinositide-specific phospholipase C [Planctomycetota bacterium]MDP6989328.1 Ca2+-dependent phosphoinositide-specific phospholipase C [Planctomycetota bacterium]